MNKRKIIVLIVLMAGLVLLGIVLMNFAPSLMQKILDMHRNI